MSNTFSRWDFIGRPLVSIFFSCLAAVVPAVELEPAYADEAFPGNTRADTGERLAAELDGARQRAEWMDGRLEKVFSPLPDGTLAKVRVGKRRFLLRRTLAFAGRYLKRGDATGLGFAERAIHDAHVLDGLLEEEIAMQSGLPDAAHPPVVLSVRDYGAKGDGKADDSPAFVRAGNAVRRLGGRPSVLRIPAGVYRMGSVQTAAAFTDAVGEYNCYDGVLRSQCLFASLENCSIEGEGPDKTFIRGGVYDANQLALVNCRNVRLAGMEVALEQTPFIEGTVDRFDPATGACELTLKPGSLAPDHYGWDEPGCESFGYLFDDKGMMLQKGRLLPWNKEFRRPSEPLGGARWRIFFNRAGNEWSYDHYVRSIRPGLTLVLPNRRNAFGGVSLRFCSFCTVEDVWVRNSRASAFGTVRSRAITFHRCRDVPRKGFTLSSDADGCFCSPGTFVYRCVFDTMGDDGLNSLSYATVPWRGVSRTEVIAPDHGIRQGGEMTVFAHPHTAQYLGNARLVQTDSLVRFTNGWARVTRFRDAVPDFLIGKYMYTPTREGIGTVVSGCTFRNGRLAGNVVQTSTSLFEDNTYENLHEGVRIGALGDYREGPPPYDVLVRNCRFDRTSVGLTAWLRMCDATKTKWFEIKCAPLRGIEALDNSFNGSDEAAILFRNAGDCTFAGNRFEGVKTEWDFKSCENINR